MDYTDNVGSGSEKKLRQPLVLPNDFESSGITSARTTTN